MSQPGCATVATSSSSRSVPANPEPKRSSFRRQRGSSLRQVVYRHTLVPLVLRVSARDCRTAGNSWANSHGEGVLSFPS